MAEATNELIYEVLKKIQRDVLLIRHDMRGLREEITAMRGHVIAIQRDISKVYDRLGGLETPVDRIERRLELAEAPV